MRRHLPLLLVLIPFAVPAAAHGTSCASNPDGTSFCHQHITSHRSATVALGSACHARRIYAIDASPVADASADAHFVAPHKIHMLNDIWSHHNTYGPLSVYGTFLSGHRILFENRSRFSVNVYFTRICRVTA